MHRRPWTVIEVGGAVLALAMLLACCAGVCLLGTFAPPR